MSQNSALPKIASLVSIAPRDHAIRVEEVEEAITTTAAVTIANRAKIVNRVSHAKTASHAKRLKTKELKEPKGAKELKEPMEHHAATTITATAIVALVQQAKVHHKVKIVVRTEARTEAAVSAEHPKRHKTISKQHVVEV